MRINEDASNLGWNDLGHPDWHGCGKHVSSDTYLALSDHEDEDASTNPAPLKNLNTMNIEALTEPASKAPEIKVTIADWSCISQIAQRVSRQRTHAIAHFLPYLSAKKPIENAATVPPT